MVKITTAPIAALPPLRFTVLVGKERCVTVVLEA